MTCPEASRRRAGSWRWGLVLALLALAGCGGTPTTPPDKPKPAAPKAPEPRVAGTPVFVLQAGHSGAVNSVAYSPTGEYVASGSSDGTVRLWELPDDAPLVAASDGEPSKLPAALPEAAVAAVRARIDARGAKILACVDASALAVRASVGSNGEVRFDPRSKTIAAEDADCVRHALGELRVETGGATGTVVQSVGR